MIDCDMHLNYLWIHWLLILIGISLGINLLPAQSTGKRDTLIIYFEHDKDQIQYSFKIQLELMKEKLFQSSNKILLIHGYADHTGSSPYNLDLSQRRAKKVVQYFNQLEVPESLIESIRGQGSVERELPPFQRVPEDRKVIVVLANRSKPLVFSAFNLDSVSRGDQLIIERLHFQPGRHILLEESIPQLISLLKILKEYPTLKIELQGHVCCAPKGRDGIDKDTQSEDLSINRAKNIYEYLIRNEIDSNRLRFKGFARTQPIYPLERNDEERKINRRVEIKILDY